MVSSLRINTSNLDSLETEDFTQGFPAVQISLSPSDERPSTADFGRSSSKVNKKARNESRKLLSHVLVRLQTRPMPPSIYDSYIDMKGSIHSPKLGALVDNVKITMKRKGSSIVRAQSQHTNTEDDSDDDVQLVYSTDYTYDLMHQLRDILLLSASQGWQIFDDGPKAEALQPESISKSSHFRISRSNLQTRGGRSRSASPAHGYQILAPEILTQCISVIASVVQEDCRYKMAASRPLRPPHALHAICLDIAQFLIYAHRYQPHVISQIGRAMITSFSTYPKVMFGKLLKFFEECVITGLLQGLSTLQIGNEPETLEDSDLSHPSEEYNPIVSIHVDEVKEETGNETGLTSDLNSSIIGPTILSSNAPYQSKSVYHLASLVPPLFGAILENVNIASDRLQPELRQRLQRVILPLAQLKFDACNDILQVIAYHTSEARFSACVVLMSVWHKAVGHVTVSEPPTNAQLIDCCRDQAIIRNHPYSHQFVPWRFSPAPHPSESLRQAHCRCRSCARPVTGFGLLCPFCMCSIHFDCYDYPQGCSLLQYSMATDGDMQKVAMYRFCRVLPDALTNKSCVSRARGHEFYNLNLFTLCLCFLCQEPLWGCSSQCVGCTSCSIFFHPPCFTRELPDLPPCGSRVIHYDRMTVDWEILRNTCLEHYGEILLKTREDLEHHSYEEVSIYLAYFWIQMRILANGIALGSIVIVQNGRNTADISQLPRFELHNLIEFCETLLSAGNLRISQMMDDYLFENRLSRGEHNLMFDWSTLTFVSTTIRTPYTLRRETSPNEPSPFLSVTNPEITIQNSPADNQPFNVVSLSHIRNALGHEFNIASRTAVHFLLEYLYHLSFFQKLDNLRESPSSYSVDGDKTTCVFTLPFGFDSSVDVEILVSAIDACLSDVNLYVNEIGFLLLTRRLWPNGMTSEYGLRRLARSVVTWILTEDNSVAIILRDFLANQKPFPGVPAGNDMLSWPPIFSSRPAANSVTNGGDYVAFRRVLHSRYAATWLLALHNQDSTLYAEMLYDSCAELVNVQSVDGTLDVLTVPMSRKRESDKCDKILRYIIKLSQATVVYSIFNDLISRWMQTTSMLMPQEPITSLPRVFHRESEVLSRFSASFDSARASFENTDNLSADPWRSIHTLAMCGGEDLTRALEWLGLLTSSGVEIPTPRLLRLATLVFDDASVRSLSNATMLVGAVFKNVWLNSVGRQDLLVLFSMLHGNLHPHVVKAINDSNNVDIALQFIRQSLSVCLLLYGCERKKLLELGIIMNDETMNLPTRRKANNRRSLPTDPITIDAGMMNALEQYLLLDTDEISCVIAKFFNAFVMDSPFLEAYEVDNFILRNGTVLAKSAWQFYGLQRPELYEIRASLFSRTIVVDPQPFFEIFNSRLLPSVPWEDRLSAVTRLFRIIQDVTNPAFRVEGRHWRSSVTIVFYFYFRSLWYDDREEIRLSVKTSASTLLLTHLQEITSCWVELLSTAPISERVKLVSFLIHMSSHFPHWKVLSWRAIVEALLEYEYDQTNSNNEDGPASAHLSMYGISSDRHLHAGDADPDMASLRVTLLLLSIRMIANGVRAEISTLLKIKKHLAELTGFQRVTEIPHPTGQSSRIELGGFETVSEAAIPCICELKAIFDAPYPFNLVPSTMTHVHEQDDKPSKLLVGSLFVDITLIMFCTVKDLPSLPVLTLKAILESLCIIAYKHNFESRPLSHLQHRLRQAVSRSLELISQDVGYELRQIAVSFIQGFVKHCSKFMGPVVYKTIEQLGKLIATEGHHPSDALVVQARSFLETTLATYAANGLFANLLKRRLEREFFVILKQSVSSSSNNAENTSDDLKNILLHDAMTRAVDADHGSLQVVLDNIAVFIEIVHHDYYSAESMAFVGHQLTNLARRASERGSDGIETSSLFLIPAVLAETNQGRIRDIMPYVENVIRIILTRLAVTFSSLFRLLSATQSLQRRNDSVIFSNGIPQVIFEVLGDGLRLKARVPPCTLTTLSQVVVYDDDAEWLPLAISYPNLFLGLVDNALHFLQNYEWPEAKTEDAFTASLSAAKIVWRAASDDMRVINKIADFGSERSISIDFAIRAWNVVVLAALKQPDTTSAAALLSLLKFFSNIQFGALRAYIHSDLAYWDPATTNINHAYIAIKLWILVAEKAASGQGEGETAVSRVWNELWPPFETLAFNAGKQMNLHPTLASLISSSVADISIFLHSLRSPLVLQTVSQAATLEQLKSMTGIDAASRKVSRVIQGLSQLPLPVPFQVLVNQTAKDIVAAEKLRVLESKRDVGKGLSERRPTERPRRDIRVPT
ncbi:hypothetical protein AX17_003473 [Amanita inopinata Kibby_2008]|nr:hypothetical protein AX17_003473 [Amanita inopinata Kibby_2008]